MDNPDINKYSIDFLSNNWSVTVALCILLIFIILFVGKKISDDKKELYAKLLSVSMIILFFTNHILLMILGKWELSKELPVHLCSISGLICCFIMFIAKDKRQFLFEFLFFFGIM